jgi:hypothetical protein
LRINLRVETGAVGLLPGYKTTDRSLVTIIDIMGTVHMTGMKMKTGRRDHVVGADGDLVSLR